MAPKPKLSDAELAQQYGLSADLINSSKELKKLFQQAVKDGWSANLFQAKLKNSKWWSTQSDTLRQYITEQHTDPATWWQKRSAALADIRVLGAQAGLSGDWFATLDKMVYNSLALGWSEARVKSYLGALTGTHDGEMFGEAGQNFDQMHALAYANGVDRTLTWYRDRTREIMSGRSTMEAVEASIRSAAAAKYSAFAPQIRAGQNAMDLAAPYIQAVSRILETPDTDVDLSNGHVLKAMTHNKGGQSYSLWQFENDLRKDPLWKRTQNAQDSAMGVARQVLTQFGVAY